jgi:hypothetical protein
MQQFTGDRMLQDEDMGMQGLAIKGCKRVACPLR